MDERPTLPSAKALCSVLCDKENLASKSKVKSTFLPLISNIFSDSTSAGDTNCNDLDNHVFLQKGEIKKEEEYVVLLSGGLGSTVALWRLMRFGISPKMIFFAENMFYPDVEKIRRECIKNVLLDSRGVDGNPLLNEAEQTTLLTSLSIAEKAKDLNRLIYFAVY